MRTYLPIYFRRQGWRCETAVSATELWERLGQYDYDAVVIAEQLSEQALHWASALRSGSSLMAAVLLLTEDRPAAKVAALDAGYDDVLPQPVSEEELRARLGAISRRQSGYLSQDIQLGTLHIRANERQVAAGNQLLTLSPKEFDLLLYLVRHRNQVVSKVQLSEYLWGDPMENAESFDFLYAHIKNLRRKLRAAGAGDLLQTVYGAGYTLRD